METEIPEELKEKLKLIERETEFFSQLPQKPRVFSLVMSVVLIVTAAGLTVFDFINGVDYFLSLFLLAIAVSNVVTYFEQRRLFKLYSAAGGIINYYKKEIFKTKSGRGE